MIAIQDTKTDEFTPLISMTYPNQFYAAFFTYSSLGNSIEQLMKYHYSIWPVEENTDVNFIRLINRLSVFNQVQFLF